jgi:hypothetical protein
MISVFTDQGWTEPWNFPADNFCIWPRDLAGTHLQTLGTARGTAFGEQTCLNYVMRGMSNLCFIFDRRTRGRPCGELVAGGYVYAR